MIVNDKIGLVLSGGGLKSLAQLGVLHYLYELKMPIHAIAGTSAGALIGAFLAQGYTPYQLLQIAKNERIFSYSFAAFKNLGVFSTDVLERMLLKHIPHNSFDGLTKQLYVHVTDLVNGSELVFNKGELGLAVKASCAFPLVFQSVPYKDLLLCDGGLMNNFPYETIAATCHLVIGINVNPINQIPVINNSRQLINRIIRITSSKVSSEAKAACTFYLEPEGIEHYGMFDTKKIDELFELGYKSAKNSKEHFLAILEQQDKIRRF